MPSGSARRTTWMPSVARVRPSSRPTKPLYTVKSLLDVTPERTKVLYDGLAVITKIRATLQRDMRMADELAVRALGTVGERIRCALEGSRKIGLTDYRLCQELIGKRK